MAINVILEFFYHDSNPNIALIDHNHLKVSQSQFTNKSPSIITRNKHALPTTHFPALSRKSPKLARWPMVNYAKRDHIANGHSRKGIPPGASRPINQNRPPTVISSPEHLIEHLLTISTHTLSWTFRLNSNSPTKLTSRLMVIFLNLLKLFFSSKTSQIPTSF